MFLVFSYFSFFFFIIFFFFSPFFFLSSMAGSKACQRFNSGKSRETAREWSVATRNEGGKRIPELFGGPHRVCSDVQIRLEQWRVRQRWKAKGTGLGERTAAPSTATFVSSLFLVFFSEVFFPFFVAILKKRKKNHSFPFLFFCFLVLLFPFVDGLFPFLFSPSSLKTDRILWSSFSTAKDSLSLVEYGRGELRSSDHRPVYAFDLPPSVSFLVYRPFFATFSFFLFYSDKTSFFDWQIWPILCWSLNRAVVFVVVVVFCARTAGVYLLFFARGKRELWLTSSLVLSLSFSSYALFDAKPNPHAYSRMVRRGPTAEQVNNHCGKAIFVFFQYMYIYVWFVMSSFRV